MSPVFSIIIPVYNVASYLPECLESVLAQTFTDWEAICVDDGSTDGSSLVLNEFASRDCRFVVKHISNSGVSIARNVALERANGEYIIFLDGDDALDRCLLSRLFEILSESREIEVVCYQARIVRDNKIQGPLYVSSISGLVPGNQILESDGYASVFTWVVWDKAIRNSVIKSAMLRFIPGMKNGEDSLFAQKLFCYTKHVWVEPELIGYYYFMREGSAIHKK